MKYTFLKRTFLNPISTLSTSYIHAHVEDSHNGAVNHGSNMLVIADCHRVVEFEFYLGTRMHRRLSVAKLNHLIDTLMSFRDALVREIELIEDLKKSR